LLQDLIHGSQFCYLNPKEAVFEISQSGSEIGYVLREDFKPAMH